MSDDGRRIFPIETALAIIANQNNTSIPEFLSFAISRDVPERCRPTVQPMVKGWLYSLNPDFMKYPFTDSTSFDAWAGEQKNRFGEFVSLTPIPENECVGLYALLDYFDEIKHALIEKEEALDEAQTALEAAEAEVKALQKVQSKAEEVEKKVVQLEEKNSALAAELKEAQEAANAFNGKVAVDENEITGAIKQMIAKIAGSIAAAPAATAATGQGDTPQAAAAQESGSSDFASSFGDFGMDAFGDTQPANNDTPKADQASSEPPSDFGFGTSGADNDGFGF